MNKKREWKKEDKTGITKEKQFHTLLLESNHEKKGDHNFLGYN